MANIGVQALFEAKQREFKTSGAGDIRFEKDFLVALNAATRRINRQADLESRIAMKTGVTSTIALSDEYQDVVEDLVTLKLVQIGQRRRNEDADIARLDRDIDDRIDMIRADIQTQAQEGDTDNESDYVGLGAGTGGVDTGGTNA